MLAGCALIVFVINKKGGNMKIIKKAELGLYEFDSPKSKIALENAKREFDNILENFSQSVENWRNKYVHYGSKDTAATDEQIKYIRKFMHNIIIGL
jgi:hypothetical protein